MFLFQLVNFLPCKVCKQTKLYTSIQMISLEGISFQYTEIQLAGSHVCMYGFFHHIWNSIWLQYSVHKHLSNFSNILVRITERDHNSQIRYSKRTKHCSKL